MNHLSIDLDKCIGCGKCSRICPVDNIVVENRKAKEVGKKCLECSHCVSTCPKGAIQLAAHEGGDDGLVSKIKKSKMFDGSMISDADLQALYDSMGRDRSKCEFFTLQGETLDRFMDAVWEIVKDKEASTPIVQEWAKWREGHDKLQPNPVLWEGKQVLFIFSDSKSDAAIASNKMVLKGLDLGIRGFHSNIIMLAYSLNRDKLLAFFPRSTHEMRMSFVIGHARRLVEPVFAPMKKFKGLIRNI